MTVKAVAQRLEVSQSLVYGLLMTGKLRGSRHGLGRGTWRISDEQIAEYLKESERKAPPAVGLKWIK